MTSSEFQAKVTETLIRNLTERGSTLFSMTWKVQVTPAQRLLFRLRASVLRTSETACTGWPTTGSKDGDKSVRTLEGAENEAARKGWNNDLCTAALATWPTPNASEPSGELRLKQDRQTRDPTAAGSYHQQLGRVVSLAAWPTAAARDWKGATHERWGTNARPLNEVAVLAGWGTPDCPRKHDSDNTAGRWYPSMQQQGLVYQAAQLAGSGPTPTGSPAGTAKPGQLNSRMSAWLMGLPRSWDMCAPSKVGGSRRSSKVPKTESEG